MNALHFLETQNMEFFVYLHTSKNVDTTLIIYVCWYAGHHSMSDTCKSSTPIIFMANDASKFFFVCLVTRLLDALSTVPFPSLVVATKTVLIALLSWFSVHAELI
jgi:hypothetical protein